MIQTLSELPKSPDLSPFVSINNKPNDKDQDKEMIDQNEGNFLPKLSPMSEKEAEAK